MKLLPRAAAWHLKFYLAGRSFPLACGIYVTNRCNFKCAMCNIFRNPKLDTIGTELYKGLIDDLSVMGCHYVSLSGGEPMMVKDVVERLAYAKKKIPYVHMVTNGYFLDDKTALELNRARIDEISISLDGMADIHDSLRGFKGAFDGAVAALENLKRFAPKISVVVNSIIAPTNVDDLYKAASLVEKLGFMHKFQPVNDHPIFDGQVTKSSHFPFAESEMAGLRRFINHIKRKGNVANSRYFLEQIPGYFLKKTEGGIFEDRCLFGYHHCEIKEDGTLFPCFVGMGWKEGFKLDRGFKAAFMSADYNKKLKELESCKLCKDNMYICYFEPRIAFPIANFVKYNILWRGGHHS